MKERVGVGMRDEAVRLGIVEVERGWVLLCVCVRGRLLSMRHQGSWMLMLARAERQGTLVSGVGDAFVHLASHCALRRREGDSCPLNHSTTVQVCCGKTRTALRACSATTNRRLTPDCSFLQLLCITNA